MKDFGKWLNNREFLKAVCIMIFIMAGIAIVLNYVKFNISYSKTFLGSLASGIWLYSWGSYNGYKRGKDKAWSQLGIKLDGKQITIKNKEPDEFDFKTEEEALRILLDMRETLRIFGVVTRADYMKLIGIEYTYHEGDLVWANLEGSCVRKTKNGYRIHIPGLVITELNI